MEASGSAPINLLTPESNLEDRSINDALWPFSPDQGAEQGAVPTDPPVKPPLSSALPLSTTTGILPHRKAAVATIASMPHVSLVHIS